MSRAVVKAATARYEILNWSLRHVHPSQISARHLLKSSIAFFSLALIKSVKERIWRRRSPRHSYDPIQTSSLHRICARHNHSDSSSDGVVGSDEDIYKRIDHFIEAGESSRSDEVWPLWLDRFKSQVDNPSHSASNLLTQRAKMYGYLLSSGNLEDWERILFLYEEIPKNEIVYADHHARIQALLKLRIQEPLFQAFLVALDSNTCWNELRDDLYKLVEFFVIQLDSTKALECLVYYGVKDPAMNSIIQKGGDSTWLPDYFRTVVQAVIRRGSNIVIAFKTVMDLHPGIGLVISRYGLRVLASRGKATLVKDLYSAIDTHDYSNRDLQVAMDSMIRDGNPADALKLFEQGPAIRLDKPHYDRAFSSVLQAYAKVRDFRSMQAAFDSLFGQGNLPNLFHYSIVLRVIAGFGQVEIANNLWNQILSRGMEINAFILNNMMYCYRSRNDLAGVEKWFQEFRKYNVVPTAHTYSILFDAYREFHYLDDMARVMKMQEEAGLPANIHSYTSMLAGFADVGATDLAEEVFEEMKEKNAKLDLPAYNAYIHALCRGGKVKKAIEILLTLERAGGKLEPDQVTYNSIMEACARSHKSDLLFTLEDRMTAKGIVRDAVNYRVLMLALVYLGRIEEALYVFDRMRQAGIAPNVQHYTVIILYYARKKEIAKVHEWYSELLKEGIEPSFVTQSILISCYCKIGDSASIEAAERIIEDTSSKVTGLQEDWTLRRYPVDSVPPFLFTDLMEEYRKDEGISKIDEVYNRFLQVTFERANNQVRPNLQTLKILLESYGSAGQWETFNILWDEVWKTGLYRYGMRKMLPSKGESESSEAKVSLYPRYGGVLNKAFKYRFEFIAHTGTIEDFDKEWKFFESLNPRINNNLWNMRVGVLALKGQVERAIELAEINFKGRPKSPALGYRRPSEREKIEEHQAKKEREEYLQSIGDELDLSNEELWDFSIRSESVIHLFGSTAIAFAHAFNRRLKNKTPADALSYREMLETKYPYVMSHVTKLLPSIDYFNIQQVLRSRYSYILRDVRAKRL